MDLDQTSTYTCLQKNKKQQNTTTKKNSGVLINPVPINYQYY